MNAVSSEGLMFSFICRACKRHDHDSCNGDTWCDCQHRVPENDRT